MHLAAVDFRLVTQAGIVGRHATEKLRVVDIGRRPSGIVGSAAKEKAGQHIGDRLVGIDAGFALGNAERDFAIGQRIGAGVVDICIEHGEAADQN